MKLAVFGDSKGKEKGINEKILNKLLKGISKQYPQPDYIIHLGDMTAGSSDLAKLEKLLERFIDKFDSIELKATIIPVFGNHEEGENPLDTSSEVVFKEVFKKFKPDGECSKYNGTVYYKDLENNRLVVLNSCHYHEENRVEGEQLEFLKNVLKANKDFKLVFVHIPPFPTGAHIGTSMDLYPDARDEFWNIIDENNVDIVFSGHEHNYSRRIINEKLSRGRYIFKNQVCQIISGGGGEKLKDKYKSKEGVVVSPIAKYHYIVIEVISKKLILNAYDINGNVIDKFLINKEVVTE